MLIDVLDKLNKHLTESDEDKGTFGNRQVEFSQDVYRLPKTPAGDASQPVGLLTQSDLENYTMFRKGDRLNLKYKGGTPGRSTYSATRNGGVEIDDIDWSDALIQELIDEKALTLL